MRKLMWFTMGFAAACGLGVWAVPANCIAATSIIAAAAALAGWKLGWKRLTLIFLGLSLGMIWYLGFMKLYLLPAQAMDGTTTHITVTATAHSYETDYGVGVDGEFDLNEKTRKIRVYVNDVEEILPGDIIEGDFNFRYTAPDGLRDPTYHAGDGILLLGYPRGPAQVRVAVERKLTHAFLNLNYTIGSRLNGLFPEKTAPLARALLLGDDYDLDYETDTAFRLSGIRHIIAVSGLHVAMLYTIVRFLALNRRWPMALMGYPILYLFALAAGFTPSVSRACIMVGLMMLSQLIDREYDSPTALAFAGLVMLMENPLVITSISFQMSFACVAGILLFDGPISLWLTAKLGKPEGKSLSARLKRWFVSSVSISLSAIILTTPIAAYYFGTISLIGVLTNLLTLWAVGLAFYGIVAALAVSLFWWKGAVIIAGAASLVMGYVTAVAKGLSSLPLAAVYTKSAYIVIWLIFVYILLAVFLLSTEKRPRILFCCAVLGLCAALLASWTEHSFSKVHLTALDVGQGQSLILHSEGRTYLIDCGGNNDEIAANTAADTLLSRGITHLDGIILTHGDRDHAGGIPYLLTRIDTDVLLLPATTDSETAASVTGDWRGHVEFVSEDLHISSDGMKITVFGPIFAPQSNENSLCVLFEKENCAILVTGDRGNVGELLLMQKALPDVDLLIAGHHGSKNSTTQALLETVRPETVFISVGEHNAYGHPAQATLDRLTAFGCEIYRTDLNGTLIFRR